MTGQKTKRNSIAKASKSTVTKRATTKTTNGINNVVQNQVVNNNLSSNTQFVHDILAGKYKRTELQANRNIQSEVSTRFELARHADDTKAKYVGLRTQYLKFLGEHFKNDVSVDSNGDVIRPLQPLTADQIFAFISSICFNADGTLKQCSTIRGFIAAVKDYYNFMLAEKGGFKNMKIDVELDKSINEFYGSYARIRKQLDRSTLGVFVLICFICIMFCYV